MSKNFFFLLVTIGWFSVNAYSQHFKIDELIIQGNKRVRSSFIKKISIVKPGVKVDSLMISQDVSRLKRLESVANATYKLEQMLDGNYKLIYTIEDNFTIIPTFNIYTTNNDEFAYKIGVYDYNWFGRNIIFGGFYLKDVFDSYAINFRAPFLFSGKTGLAFNIQNLTLQDPIYFNESPTIYSFNNVSYEVIGLHQFDLQNRIEVGLNFFKEEYTYQSGEINPEALLNPTANKWMLRGIYDYNKLNFEYQYVSGYRSNFNLQCVHSSNDMLPSFIIGWNDFSLFKRVGSKGNWASRLHLGLTTNHSTPFAPFALDNNKNIRGVGNTVDKGTAIMVFNTEYRQTLFEKKWFVLQGNAFVDSGTWRMPGGSYSSLYSEDNISVYPGLGLRFIHKRIFNAIFRLDYGYGITKDATHGLVFGIGQYF